MRTNKEGGTRMISIAKKEFLSLIKSIKAIVIIIIFVFFSYYLSEFLAKTAGEINDKGAVYSSIRFLVFILGYLFASILSHNTINKEMELKTVRLVITKISRSRFWLGKYFGILLFWFVCLTVTCALIAIMSGTIDISVYFMTLITMLYFVSLIMLLSTVIEKTALSNFFGLLLGIFIPLIGIWLTLKEGMFFGVLKYFFPYTYILNNDITLLVPVAISGILVMVSLLIFNKKEL